MTLSKIFLSGSTDGKGILVTGTDSTGATTIHTVINSVTSMDEVWLYVQNNHTTDLELTIEFGGTSIENLIKKTITFKDGLICVVPGLILNNNIDIKAYTSVDSVLSITGYVNRINI